MLKMGLWGRCHHPGGHPPQGGEELSGKSDAPGRSLAKYELVVRVESSTGDKGSDPNAGRFLSWVVSGPSHAFKPEGLAF